MTHNPHSYRELMKYVDEFPEAQRPNTMFCIWINNSANVLRTVGCSYHDFDPNLKLDDLTQKSGMKKNWNSVLIWFGANVPDKDICKQIINEKVK
jgi:hypothetical protein